MKYTFNLYIYIYNGTPKVFYNSDQKSCSLALLSIDKAYFIGKIIHSWQDHIPFQGNFGWCATK